MASGYSWLGHHRVSDMADTPMRHTYTVFIGVVGSRKFNNFDMLCAVLDHLVLQKGPIQVVSGGAAGADSLAIVWANDRKMPVPIVYPAMWADLSHDDAIVKERRDKNQTKYDARAGFRRNQTIVDNSSAIMAFVLDSKDPTRGTQDTIDRAYAAGKPVFIFGSGR